MTWTWLGIAAAAFLVFSCCNGYRRGFIKEIVSMFFVALSILLVWVINPYVNEFLRENTPLYEKVQESCGKLVQEQENGVGSMGQSEQSSLIEGLEIPDLLKSSLLENNRAEVYQYLSVDSFTDYVTGYIATAVVNGLSFILSFLLSTLLIRMVTYALNIIAHLPVIRGVNKITGALVGAAKGVIFIWIAFLILTALCNTEIGKAGLRMIQQDYFLNTLYGQDIFVKIFMSIFYGK